MSNLDIINEMQGSKQKIIILDKELEVQQLTARELAKYATFQEKKDVEGAMSYIIRTTFKKDDIPDEKIDNLSPQFIMKLIPELLKANGLAGDAEKKQEDSSPPKIE